MVSIRELLGEREIALAVCVDTVPRFLTASPSVKRVHFFHPQPLHAILRGRRDCNDLSSSLCTPVRASELYVFLGCGAASFRDLCSMLRDSVVVSSSRVETYRKN